MESADERFFHKTSELFLKSFFCVNSILHITNSNDREMLLLSDCGVHHKCVVLLLPLMSVAYHGAKLEQITAAWSGLNSPGVLNNVSKLLLSAFAINF